MRIDLITGRKTTITPIIAKARVKIALNIVLKSIGFEPDIPGLESWLHHFLSDRVT